MLWKLWLFFCGMFGLRFDGVLVIFREMYVRERIVSDHAEAIKLSSKGMHVVWTVADHDAEDSETLRRSGVVSRPAVKDKPMNMMMQYK